MVDEAGADITTDVVYTSGWESPSAPFQADSGSLTNSIPTPQIETYFDTPPVRINTSFTSETAVVKQYLKATANGEPKIAYEFWQNHCDADNTRIGPVESYAVLKDGSVIPWNNLIELDGSQIERLDGHVAYWEMSNHIRKDALYHPEHLWQIRHGGSEFTLGEHGQGGTAGLEALVSQSNHHASLIEVISQDEKGPWRALMTEEKTTPDQDYPELTIHYQRSGGETEKTFTRVWEPSVTFLKTLRQIPNHFLLARSEYPYCAMNNPDIEKNQNPLTVSVIPMGDDSSVVFSQDELQKMKINVQPEYSYIPRVEVIAETVKPDENNQIYVDGILLKGFHKFALRWSVWGFRDGDYWDGYKISRSSDSTYANGNYDNLLTLALNKCESSEVFETILDSSLKSENVLERTLNFRASTLSVESALKVAWAKFAIQNDITPDTYIVTSVQDYDATIRNGNKAFILYAPSYVSELERLQVIPKSEKIMTDTTQSKIVYELTNETIDSYRISSMNSAIRELFLSHTFGGEIHFIENGLRGVSNPPRSEKISKFSDHDYMLRSHVERMFRIFADEISVSISHKTNDQLIVYQLRAESQDNETIVRMTTQVRAWNKSDPENVSLVIFSTKNPVSGRFQAFLKDLSGQFSQISSDGIHIDEAKYNEKYYAQIDVLDKVLQDRQRQLEELEAKIVEKGGKVTNKDQASDSLKQGGKPYESSSTPENHHSSHISLFAPDASPEAHMFKSESELPDDDTHVPTLDELKNNLVSEMLKLDSPSIQLLRPLSVPVRLRQTVLCTVNPRYAGPITQESITLPNALDIEHPGIKINEIIDPGSFALPIIPEHELIGWYHPDPKIQEQLTILTASEYGIYSLNSTIEVPQGLELYFAPHTPDASSMHKNPTQSEYEPLTNIELLHPHWQDLITTINADSNLTDKQKVDILLAAWTHSFTYLDDNSYDLPLTMPRADRYASIINDSRGNCGMQRKVLRL